MAQQGIKIVAVILALAAFVAACGPEASRSRGGGPGGDIGNRTLGASMDIHGQTDPLFGEPTVKGNVAAERR